MNKRNAHCNLLHTYVMEADKTGVCELFDAVYRTRGDMTAAV